MSEQIEIKWQAATQLDKTRKHKLFEDLRDSLVINLYTKEMSHKITSININRKMILAYCHFDRQSSCWDIETILEDWKFLSSEGIQKFSEFLASGYLKTDVDHIWKYLLLACAFKSEQFVLALIKFQKGFPVIYKTDFDMISNQFAFLRTVQNESTDFMAWLVKYQFQYFNASNLVNLKPNVIALILQAKVKTHQQILSDLKELEKAPNIGNILHLIPWEFCQINVVEHYRNRLGQFQCMQKINLVAQRITREENKLQNSKLKLAESIEKSKAIYEEKLQRLYVCQMQNLIKSEKLQHPERYTSTYTYQASASAALSPKGGNGRKSESAMQIQYQKMILPRKPSPPRKSIDEQQWKQFLNQKAPPKNHKHIKVSQKKMKVQDQDIKKPPSTSKLKQKVNKAPQMNFHNSDFCGYQKAISLDCGDQICLQCLIQRYYNRTQDFQAISQGKPFNIQKWKKGQVDCWICQKLLTRNDIVMINSLKD